MAGDDDKAADPGDSNFGVDTLNNVSEKVLTDVTKFFKAPPFFWARYFQEGWNCGLSIKDSTRRQLWPNNRNKASGRYHLLEDEGNG